MKNLIILTFRYMNDGEIKKAWETIEPHISTDSVSSLFFNVIFLFIVIVIFLTLYEKLLDREFNQHVHNLNLTRAYIRYGEAYINSYRYDTSRPSDYNKSVYSFTKALNTIPVSLILFIICNEFMNL